MRPRYTGTPAAFAMTKNPRFHFLRLFRLPSGVIHRYIESRCLNSETICSTNWLSLFPRSTGITFNALRIAPIGKKKNSFFIKIKAGIPWLKKASSPHTKSQLDVCGTEIITAFFSVGNSPLYFQPASHMINLARYFILRSFYIAANL